MKPTVGRIVHYVLSEQDCKAISNRRKFQANFNGDTGGSSPVLISRGNLSVPGTHVAMIITAVFPGNTDNRVNGQLILDGDDSQWVTSAAEGEGGGNWHWPEREDESDVS